MFSKGDIVIISFPFSDFTHSKKRPVVVIADRGQDIVACAITSNLEGDGIPLLSFEKGKLLLPSKIKYWQIHTFDKRIILNTIAKVYKKDYGELTSKINEMIRA